jgi:cytoskeleton protein RodZ
MNEGRLSDSAASSLETSAGSPGTILRRCREFHGITLEEASESTKIGISHLKALEDDRIREFANQAYLKGFLRIYATYLGLNSEDVSRMYEKLFGVKGEKPDPTKTQTSPAHVPPRMISLKKLLLPALILTAILIVATFFKQSPTSSRPPSQTAVATTSAQAVAAVHAVQSSASDIKTEPRTKSLNLEKKSINQPEPEVTVTPKRLPEISGGFILKIKATQNGTLAAMVDGSGAQQYELTIGDVIEWKAEKKVALDLSNGGGVDVELNGKPYKSLGPAGKPVYVEIAPDVIKQ